MTATAIRQLRRQQGAGQALGRNGAEIVAGANGQVDLRTASGQLASLNDVPISTLLATQDRVLAERRSFTETTGAGVYTGAVTVPAGAVIVDIKFRSTVLWTAATSATLKVGDAADDDGWFVGVNLKATDLAVGEELNFENLGGKEGAYILAASGLRSAAYSASARVVSAIVTTVGASGSAGRSLLEVLYTNPTASAAAKV